MLHLILRIPKPFDESVVEALTARLKKIDEDTTLKSINPSVAEAFYDCPDGGEFELDVFREYIQKLLMDPEPMIRGYAINHHW
ncbi:hypothetical protein BDV29DRAFT_192341 [Aspergillus leporis]|jgi:hypothetical protein|uniref:Uncharacterized protein n=1 Tax=Aspergillus leporis TaxID=41062 RepID=A0A5N5WY75_9EURO|nr:hypothetical protein BDV29DRAFT_192341 [Aspergillus leporis]